jgi:TonB family protein
MFGWNETALYSTIIGTAFKSTVLLGLAWALASLLRKRSAAARHLVWTSAAAGILILPVLSLRLPALRIGGAFAMAAPPLSGVVFQSSVTDSPGQQASQPGGRSRPVPAFEPKVGHFNWMIGLMVLWAAGAAASIARMLAACAAMRRVRRSAPQFPDGGLCRSLSQTLAIRRAVEVVETETGSMPMTFGVLRSTVFMPSDALGWSEERLRIVLLHELAHVRRADAATHLLARSAAAVYWWNPLAWVALREFLKERERAADDLVLNAGTRASEYAGHLLEVARTMQASPAGSMAVAMARPAQLESRLAAILDSTTDRKTLDRTSALVAMFLTLGMIAPLAAVRAQDDHTQTVPADVDSAIRSAAAQKNYEVLENAATAAEQLRKFDTAQALLQSAVEIRADVSGRHSVAYGLGLLKLGDLESKRDLNESAENFYTRAAEVLGDRPEASRAVLHLGTSAVLKENYPQAIDYFQHAERIDPARAGEAVMWMAVVRMREQNPAEAETLFNQAMSLQNPKTPEAVVTMKVFAQFLRQQARDGDASEMDARAAAMQKANAPPAPPLSSGVYRIGGGVTPPKVLQKVEPQYSPEARVARLQGTVSVTVEIGPDGLARNPQIVRGLGLGMDEKAIEAISQWHFQPGTKEGRPVTVLAAIETNFRLL